MAIVFTVQGTLMSIEVLLLPFLLISFPIKTIFATGVEICCEMIGILYKMYIISTFLSNVSNIQKV